MKLFISTVNRLRVLGLFPMLLTLLVMGSALACGQRTVPIKATQPNGKVLHIFATGDSYYHWMHDKDNYTIVTNANDYYVYADLVDGKLVPTSFVVGDISGVSTGLKPELNISEEAIVEIENREKQTDNRPSFLGSIKEHRKASNARFGAATMTPLVFFVRFKGEPEFTLTRDHFNEILNTDANSLKEYYKWNSYNQLTITSTLVGTDGNTIVSYEHTKERKYYQLKSATNPDGYEEADRDAVETQLWKDVLTALKSKVSSGLNLDQDQNGEVDGISMVVSGGVEGKGQILWPHKRTFTTGVKLNGADAEDILVVFETDHDAALFSHEMGHNLGARDYYRNFNKVITPLGSWELMASQQTPQQSMTAYVKWKCMGFIDDIPTITESGYYTLTPLGTSPSAYKIPSTKAGEYYVVEYRRKTASGFESSIKGSGLLIYRVNILANGNTQKDVAVDELYVYREGGSDNETNGTLNNAFFSQESGRTEFNDDTSPNGFLSNSTSNGHLNIYEIGSAGNTIRFYYKKPYCTDVAVKKLSFIATSTSDYPDLTETIEEIRATGDRPVKNGDKATFVSTKIVLGGKFKAAEGSKFICRPHTCLNNYKAIPPIARIISEVELGVSSGQELEEEPIITSDGMDVTLFPNPSEGLMNIEGENVDVEQCTIEIFTLAGEKIKSSILNESQWYEKNHIDVRDLNEGTYLMRVSAGERSVSKLFIIK